MQAFTRSVVVCTALCALVAAPALSVFPWPSKAGSEGNRDGLVAEPSAKVAINVPRLPELGSGTRVIREMQAKGKSSEVVRGRRKRRLTGTVKPEIGLAMRRPDAGVAPTTRTLLSGVSSWAYQLSGVSPGAIRSCKVDLAVIDYSSDGTLANAFTRKQVHSMRDRPAGGTTKVVAYMSIGEAESYRDFYWRKEWVADPSRRPKWLGPANDEGWSDNYRVRYWDPEWQKLILGSPQAYLDRLIDSGFDGVYLDIVDGFEFWQDPERSPDGGRASAADEMIEFVSRIARYAWSKNPSFLVIPQNGEALLESEVFQSHISAIAVEDVFFTWLDEGDVDDVKPSTAAEANARMAHLQRAMREKIPVLAVEYLMDQPEDRRLVGETDARLRGLGLVPHFAERQLGRLCCPKAASEINKQDEKRLLTVDWSDPEIAAFVRERSSRPLQSFTAQDERALSQLRLPVLAFDRPPGLIGRAFAPQALPKRNRQILSDPDNPIWYTIVEEFGGVTVTIDGDLRVQTVLPAGTPLTLPAGQGASVEPDISVIDDKVEEGMEGLIAEYTVRRFPDIPYRVSIECSPATKQFCTDKAALLRDREGLQIISARPPQ